MAVELKFSICEAADCKSLTFKELTGSYDAASNTGGWGGTNEATTDAITATLTITSPSGITYNDVNLFNNSYPTVDVNAGVVINPPSTLTEFEDGFWEFTYSVTTSTATYTANQKLFLFCKVEAEVCELIADLDVDDCTCDLEKVNRALQANAYMQALMYAVGVANTCAVTEIHASLKRLIDCSICK
jgi:hypothetical protein